MGDEEFTFASAVEGHRNWITTLACPSAYNATVKLVSGSRDNTIVSWVDDPDPTSGAQLSLTPSRRLEDHKRFISDVALTSNADYAISSSWDRSLRLWNLQTGHCMTKFLGHTKDVLSVTMSPDNRYVLSGDREGELRMWNISGDCVHSVSRAHADWISSIRFSPVQDNIVAVSGGWDHQVKVWSLSAQELRCMQTFSGHTNYVSTVTVSPDGVFCASAGKDGTSKVWDIATANKMCDLDCESPVHKVAFSPSRYWLASAAASGVMVWDLETKKRVAKLVPVRAENSKQIVECTSLAWSMDGATLYSGYTDGKIRIWTIS